MLDSSIRSGSLGQPSPAALSYQSSSPVPVGGSSYNSPDYSLQPFSSSPESQGQPQYSAASVHMVPGSPQARHRTVGTNTPPSPGFGRRAVNPTMAAPGSPSLSHRQVMGPSGPGFHGNVVSGHPASAATTPGSPSLGRHPVGSHQVPGLHSSVVTTPGSPSLGRHPGAHQGNLASSLHSNAVISPGSQAWAGTWVGLDPWFLEAPAWTGMQLMVATLPLRTEDQHCPGKAVPLATRPHPHRHSLSLLPTTLA